jgi:hypothetical protein
MDDDEIDEFSQTEWVDKGGLECGGEGLETLVLYGNCGVPPLLSVACMLSVSEKLSFINRD